MWKKEPLYRLIILISWAIFLLVLLISGKFKLYVNSIYSPLIISGVIILFALIINGFKTFKEKSKHSHQLTATKFIGLFIILFPILLAILIKPGNLPLSAAITRGISTSISTTDTNFLDILKSQVESDESYKKLNLKQLLTIVSRQPDKIDGLQVAVEGFAHQNQEEPSNSLTIVRFLITCCAADATP